jgi:hypothetical protein
MPHGHKPPRSSQQNEIEDQIDGCSNLPLSDNSCAVKLRNIAFHQFDTYSGSRGPATCNAQRPPDRIDAGRLPAQLREIDGAATHATTEIEDAAWSNCLGTFKQLAQLP